VPAADAPEGRRTLFSGVDATVADGLTWVKGPSGIGKSELLRVVAGLVVGEGTRTLVAGDGEWTPAQLGWPTWRSRVAYAPQNPPRFERSGDAVLEEVASLSVRRGRTLGDARALASRWGLDERAWSASMQDLSGGELQRLWLAVVLSGEPDAVLLDEPTAALDPDVAAAVEADLRGRVGLVVTHDAAFGARVSVASITLANSGEAG
jgi:ABC-type multidrug transport system ATPase subunit